MSKKWVSANDISAFLDKIYGQGTALSVKQFSRPVYPDLQANQLLPAARGSDMFSITASSSPLKRRGRVLHSVATWRNPKDDKLYIIKIDPGKSPQSSTDWFILNLSRARSECLLTTGKILADEPDSRHDTWASAPLEGLAPWRSELFVPHGNGSITPTEEGEQQQQQQLTASSMKLNPATLVLSRSCARFLTHPLVAAAKGPVVLAGGKESGSIEEEKMKEGERAPGVNNGVIFQPNLQDVRQATVFAVTKFGHVLIEAGECAKELYPSRCSASGPPQDETCGGTDSSSLLVDELVLSVYEEAHLEEALIGGPCARSTVAEFRDLFPNFSRGPDQPLDEESGKWSFYRFWR